MEITAIANQQAGALTMETDVCIAGDGPAGMIMGLFLAKQGMDVIVLEKRANFHQKYQQEQSKTAFMKLMCELETFKGMAESIKPAMQEMLLFMEEEKVQQLLMRPLYKQDSYMNRMVIMALYKQAEQYPNFTMMPGTSVKEILWENDRIAGVFAETEKQDGYFIHSKITIGIDEQHAKQIKNPPFECSSSFLASEADQAAFSDAI